MLLTSAASLLVPLLSWLSGDKPSNGQHHELPLLQFELRQLHAVSADSAHVMFSDVSSQALNSLAAINDSSGSTKASYGVHTRRAKTYRPSSFEAYTRARVRSMRFGENEWLDWEEDEISSPDVESRTTLLELAKMTNNAYVEPDDPAWYDLDGKWNIVCNALC